MSFNKTLTTDDYAVAWLCARPENELLAAVSSLDEEHRSPMLRIDDTNSYHFGAISGHNIVIACMPPGDPGTVSANTLVQQLKASFKSLKIHLFVGIGGGVPHDPPSENAEDDIHLGDVVVGWPKETGAPAVVQYDLGRSLDGRFQITGHLDRPERRLITAFGSILMNQRRHRTRFQQWLAQMIAQAPSFEHPGLTEDKLFRARYRHGNAADCSGCTLSELVMRPPRLSTDMVFHQSTIASGNLSMRSALERDRISCLCGGARCFEMEAAGVMNEIRPLIIRGIAGYADGHKTKRWHDYAAAAAAAFAKEFLYTTAPTDVQRLQPVALYDEIRESLKPYLYNPRFRTVSMAYENTYCWIWNTKAQMGPGFLEWLQEKGQRKNPATRCIFWIKGKPGAGKSTLMKNIFQDLRGQGSAKKVTSNNKLARLHNKEAKFFFHKMGADSEMTFQGLLSACLAQIYNLYPQLMPTIADVFEGIKRNSRHTEYETWTANGVKDALNAIACQTDITGSMVLYIDGLDECGGNLDQHLEYLTNLIKSTARGPFRVRACISSRTWPEISKWLADFPGLTIHDWTAQDVLAYVSGNLKGFATQGLSISNMDVLKREILRKAEGVFIWVKVVVNELLSCLSRGERFNELLTVLENLPSDIMDLYDEILCKIEELGCLRNTALWLEILRNHHGQSAGLTLIDFFFMDSPAVINTQEPVLMAEEDMVAAGIRMQKRLQAHSRDLVQFHNNGSSLREVCLQRCTLIHATLEEFMKLENWQTRIQPLGDAIGEKTVYENLMNIYLQRARHFTGTFRMQHIREFFCIARNYEITSSLAATRYLRSLESNLNKFYKDLFYQYLKWEYEYGTPMDQNVFWSWEMPESNKSDLLIIGIYHSVQLFVKEELGQSTLSQIPRSLLHFAFQNTYRPPASLQMVEHLLKNNISANATFCSIFSDSILRERTVLDSIIDSWTLCYAKNNEDSTWPKVLILLLKHGAYVKDSALGYVLRAIPRWSKDRQELLCEMLKSGAASDPLSSDGELVYGTAIYGIPDIEDLREIVLELDVLSPRWRIEAHEEHVARAENAVKEAAMCQDLRAKTILQTPGIRTFMIQA